MTTVIFDTEPRWLEFQAALDRETYQTLPALLARLDSGACDLLIISNRLMQHLPAIKRIYAGRIEVATAQRTTKEAIEAYRAGALDYYHKDFRVS